MDFIGLWRDKINPNLENVRILNRVRLIAINSQIALILFATLYLDILLPIQWLFSLVTFEVAFQLFSWHRVKQQLTIGHGEILIHILFDSLILAALVYFSGGPNNPFIYLLLLSIALGTLMLRPKELVVVAIVQLALYSILNLYQRPLELGDSSPLASFHLHLMGMWVNFALTVILIATFGFLARQSMLKKEKQIQVLREKQLKDEQVLSLGIMSASAAHELGTPLSTMAIVVDDLKHEDVSQAVKSDMELLAQQIGSCRNIIQSLSDKSRYIRKQLADSQRLPNQGESVGLEKQLAAVIDNWLVYRPQIKLTSGWKQFEDNLKYHLPISVEQAVTNLLDNAADAGLENGCDLVEVTLLMNSQELIIDIVDGGKGISEDLKQSAGSNIQETRKKDGLGWGLFLSNASIERAGGRVQLQQQKDGGTLTRISLPLEALA